MININKNTNLQKDLKLNHFSFMADRMVFEGQLGEKGPAVGGGKIEKLPSSIDIKSPDFDNIAFKAEKRGKFSTDINFAIKDAINQVPELRDNQIDELQNEFSTGLRENILAYKNDIAEAIRVQSPALYADTNNLTNENANEWFQKVLINLKCSRVGLIYDITDDTTKFKFYGAKGEIKFKSGDIKIQYIPKELKTSAEPEKTEQPNKFQIGKIEQRLKNKSIDHVALITKYIGRAPEEGERVVIERGNTKLKGHFDGKKNLFISDDGTQLWFIGARESDEEGQNKYDGDLVTFYPKITEKKEAEDKIEIDGIPYIILRQIDTKSSYLDVAKAILQYTPGQGAIIPGGQQILDEGACVRIASSKISVPEYAALLKAAHEKLGNKNRLPIVIPASNLERKFAIRAAEEAPKAQTQEKEIIEKSTAELVSQLKVGLDVAQNQLEPRERKVIAIYMAKCEARLAREKNPSKQAAIIQELLDKVDDYFKEAGFTRKISKKLENVMDVGKNGIAWKELWTEENPTVKKVMDIIQGNSDVFGTPTPNKNTVRGIVYDLIRTGNASSFDSGDIIKYFNIKSRLPVPSKEYDEILGLASISTDAVAPALKEKQTACRKFVSAIEGLSIAIAGLDPSQNKEIIATDRVHEKLALKAEEGAKNLRDLIDLLNVKSSTRIIKKGEEDTWTSTIEKGGKKITLRLHEEFPGQTIGAYNIDSGAKIWEEKDYGAFDAPDYVNKINALISTQAKSKSAEKTEEQLKTIELSKKGAYFSLRSLETLSEGVPGVPVTELLEVKKEKGKQFIDNNLAKRTKEILGLLGVINEAKFVDTPENLSQLKDNDQVLINIRYKGKDITLFIDSRAIGWTIKMAPGFNNTTAKKGDTAYVQDFNLDWKKSINGINAIISKKGYGNTERMLTSSNVERVSILQKQTDEFNKILKTYTSNKANNYPYDLSLTVSQTMEALFRTYNFEELKEIGCVKKVADQEKAYMITSLPDKFKNIGQDHKLLKLIYSIKYGSNYDSSYKEVMSSAAETVRESASEQAKYTNRLQKLFAVGLTIFDSKGKKVTMGETGNKDETDLSKDEYFKKISGEAAYNDFYEQVRTRNEKDAEIIDINKTNTKLTDLYQKGLVKLNMLAKTDDNYAALNKQVSSALRSKRINLNIDLTDLDRRIIRLGYLQDVEMREKDQSKGLEQFKSKLIENILKLLPDKIEHAGQFITKNQAATTLESFPVGVLLSYSRNSDGSNTIGAYAPITLNVFGSDYAKLVLIPGANSTEGLKMAVGVSFTNKDPKDKSQNIILMGGVSVGIGTMFTEASFGAAMSGGVDFRIVKADQINNYNHYLGIKGGIGLDITNDVYGFNVGPAYTWEIDAQQKYNNSLREYFKKEGIQGYIDQLADIYAKGSDTKAIDAFVSKLKSDRKMAQQLDLRADTTSEEALNNFELYVAGLMNRFNEKFNLPLVVGGQLGLGVVDGAIMATGASTGNIPLLLGGATSWGIQALASLKFNVGSRMVTERKQTTSEAEMKVFLDQSKQERFNDAFENLPRSKEAALLYASGRTTLDIKGHKQTTTGVEIQSSSTEVQADHLGNKLNNFNRTLVEKGIDIQLKKHPDNRIELVLLDSNVAANEKILISPDLTITEGEKIFLKYPNNLSFLYIDKQTRKYPLETSHGATMETVITISDNRFYKGNTFPTETSVTRYNDNKEHPSIVGKVGVAEAFKDNAIDYSRDTKKLQNEMKNALDKSQGIEKEPVRKNLKSLAQKISLYTNKNGENFLSITNEKAKTNLDNPNYLAEKLYAFYDDFAAQEKIDTPFNASERHLLTLELSTLRYKDLMAGAPNAAERERRFQKRLEWAKPILLPYFEKRLTELRPDGKILISTTETIKQRAKFLVDQAIEDLQSLHTTMETTKLEEGTSVAIAVGAGGNGLHQIIDGTRDKLQTEDVDKYGYIMGKDYTKAIRTGVPTDDHDIGLILMGQLSTLPESSNLKGFMDSNLARKLASNKGLIHILNKEDYSKVVDYYKGDTSKFVRASELTKFIDLVKKIRDAEQEGEQSISVKSDNGKIVLIKINSKVQAGIFQECANYSAAITEKIIIIPPSQEDALVLLAGKNEGITSLTTTDSKKFTSLTGGVAATATLTQPKASGGTGEGGGPKEYGVPPAKGEKPLEPGAKGGTGQGAGESKTTTPSQTSDNRAPIAPPAPDSTDSTKDDSGGV